MVRITFSNFAACCRLARSPPHFAVFDDDTVRLPDVPVIVLAQEQVATVHSAVFAAYGVSLIEWQTCADSSVVGGAIRSLCNCAGQLLGQLSGSPSQLCCSSRSIRSSSNSSWACAKDSCCTSDTCSWCRLASLQLSWSCASLVCSLRSRGDILVDLGLHCRSWSDTAAHCAMDIRSYGCDGVGAFRAGGGKRARGSQAQRVTLVYHGTFAPFHPGHGSVLRSACEALRVAGLEVVRVVVGVTNEGSAERKLKGSQWIRTDKRVEMIRAVLLDMDIEGVLVEPTASRTAYVLSDKHSCSTRPPIFLVGSDLMYHPAASTLVVARDVRKTRAEYFDHHWWSGVCRQDGELCLSSTLVRAFVDRGAIPSNYGARAVASLQDWAGRFLVKEVVPELAVQSSQSFTTVKMIAAAKSSSSSGAAGSNDAAGASPSSVVAPRAPPLPPSELAATYGVGYRLLKGMGYDDDGTEPLIGVTRKKGLGLQENEYRGGVVARRPARDALPVGDPLNDALPKRMPRRRTSVVEVRTAESADRRTQIEDVQVVEPADIGAGCALGAPNREPLGDVVEAELVESSDGESSDSSVSTYLRGEKGRLSTLTGPLLERRDRHVITIALKKVRESGGVASVRFEAVPHFVEMLHAVVREVCGILDEQVLQLLKLVPYGQMSLMMESSSFASKIATRVQAEVCAARRIGALLGGNLTLPEWIYSLWRDLAGARGSNHDKATDWLFAETASFIVLGGVLVDESLRLAIAASPGKPLASREDLLGIVLQVVALDNDRLLDNTGDHYKGCECKDRRAEHIVDLRIESLDGWRARDFHRLVCPVLARCWNAFLVTPRVGANCWFLRVMGYLQPACLLPVLFLDEGIIRVVILLSLELGFDVVSMNDDEIPVRREAVMERDSVSQIRRRSLSLQRPLAALTCAEVGGINYLCCTMSSPIPVARFPSLVGATDMEGLTALTTSIYEDLVVTGECRIGGMPGRSRSPRRRRTEGTVVELAHPLAVGDEIAETCFIVWLRRTSRDDSMFFHVKVFPGATIFDLKQVVSLYMGAHPRKHDVQHWSSDEVLVDQVVLTQRTPELQLCIRRVRLPARSTFTVESRLQSPSELSIRQQAQIEFESIPHRCMPGAIAIASVSSSTVLLMVRDECGSIHLSTLLVSNIDTVGDICRFIAETVQIPSRQVFLTWPFGGRSPVDAEIPRGEFASIQTVVRVDMPIEASREWMQPAEWAVGAGRSRARGSCDVVSDSDSDVDLGQAEPLHRWANEYQFYDLEKAYYDAILVDLYDPTVDHRRPLPLVDDIWEAWTLRCFLRANAGDAAMHLRSPRDSVASSVSEGASWVPTHGGSTDSSPLSWYSYRTITTSIDANWEHRCLEEVATEGSSEVDNFDLEQLVGDENAAGQCLVGGAGRGSQGSGSRSRSPRLRNPCHQSMVAPGNRIDDLAPTLPSWTLDGEDLVGPHHSLHVSVGDAQPVSISVPEVWSCADTSWMLSRHIGYRLGWVDYTWVGTDVLLEHSSSWPRLEGDNFLKLLEAVDRIPPTALHGHAFLPAVELGLGCALSEQRVTTFTSANRDVVRNLIASVAALVPEITFNSLTLTFSSTSWRSAGFTRAGAQEVTLVPVFSDYSESWLWFQTANGGDSVLLDGVNVPGVWLPFNRIICLSAVNWYKVCVNEGLGYLTLTKKQVANSRHLVEELAHVEFPLDAQELDLLACNPDNDFGQETSIQGGPSSALRSGIEVPPVTAQAEASSETDGEVLRRLSTLARMNEELATAVHRLSQSNALLLGKIEELNKRQETILSRLPAGTVPPEQDVADDTAASRTRQSVQSAVGARQGSTSDSSGYRSRIAIGARPFAGSLLPRHPASATRHGRSGADRPHVIGARPGHRTASAGSQSWRSGGAKVCVSRKNLACHPYEQVGTRSSGASTYGGAGESQTNAVSASNPVLGLEGVEILHFSSSAQQLLDCLVHLSRLTRSDMDWAWHCGLVAELTQHASGVAEAVQLFRAGTRASVRLVSSPSDLDWRYGVPESYYLVVFNDVTSLFSYTPPLGSSTIVRSRSDISPTVHFSPVDERAGESNEEIVPTSTSSSFSPLGRGVVQVTKVRALATELTAELALEKVRSGLNVVVDNYHLDKIDSGMFQINLELKLEWRRSRPEVDNLVEIVAGQAGQPLVGGVRKRPASCSTASTTVVAVRRDSQVDTPAPQLSLPRWRRSGGGIDDIVIQVSVTGQPWRKLKVPDESREFLEQLIADHLAVVRHWLQFEWDHLHVGVYWSCGSPEWKLKLSSELYDKISWFVDRSRFTLRRSSMQKVRTLSFGYRSTRKAGLTALTGAHPTFVKQINAMVAVLAPGVTYQSFAVVVHGSVPPHVDGMNSPESLIHVISGSEGWIWIESITGADAGISVPDRKGVVLALNRGVISFPASRRHEIKVAEGAMAQSLVLYTTRRVPDDNECHLLRRLGFPLGIVVPVEPAEAEGLDCDRERDGVGPCAVEECFQMIVHRVSRDGQEAVRAARLDVTMMHGSTFADLRTVVKKCLKVNPDRILFMLRGSLIVPCDEDDLWHVRDKVALAIVPPGTELATDETGCPIVEADVVRERDEQVAGIETVAAQPTAQVAAAPAVVIDYVRVGAFAAVAGLLDRAQEETQTLQSTLAELRTRVAALECHIGGGKRVMKVSRAAVEAAAIQAICSDISGIDTVTSGKFIQHIVEADTKAARAITQAAVPAHRLSAFAAACHRAGLPDQSQHFARLAKDAERGALDGGMSSAGPASSQVADHQATAGQPVVHQTIVPTVQPLVDVVQLQERLASLEEWSEQFSIRAVVELSRTGARSGAAVDCTAMETQLQEIRTSVAELSSRISVLEQNGTQQGVVPHFNAIVTSLVRRLFAAENGVKFIAARLEEVSRIFSGQILTLKGRVSLVTSRQVQSETETPVGAESVQGRALDAHTPTAAGNLTAVQEECVDDDNSSVAGTVLYPSQVEQLASAEGEEMHYACGNDEVVSVPDSEGEHASTPESTVAIRSSTFAEAEHPPADSERWEVGSHLSAEY
eukprot:6463879-Amphidinium_carterae.3